MDLLQKSLSNFNNKYLNNDALIAALTHCDAYTFTTSKNVHEFMTYLSLVFRKQKKRSIQILNEFL